MDAVKFITSMSQICQNSLCVNCVLSSFCGKVCYGRTKEDAEKATTIVEKWLKDRPAKTRQTEFLKKFPNAAVSHGTIDILPCKFDKTLAEDCDGAHPKKCIECKDVYWSKEVE